MQEERSTGQKAAEGEPKRRGSRIDGADLRRETIFDLGKRGNWVQERDLEFFRNATSGPLEGGEAASAEEKATVQVRCRQINASADQSRCSHSGILGCRS